MGEISDALARAREREESAPAPAAPRRPPARAPTPAPPLRDAPPAADLDRERAPSQPERSPERLRERAPAAPPAEEFDRHSGPAAPPAPRSEEAAPAPRVERRLYMLPRARTGSWVGRLCVVDPDSPAAVRFRQLAVRLRALLDQRALKSVLVTSALAGEGKSTVSINLGLALASIAPDSRIALVDLDLRRSTFAEVLELSPRIGIERVLEDRATLGEAAIRTDLASLDVLPVANTTSDAQRLLGLGGERVFRQLHARYDYVVCDGPPVLPVPDVPQIAHLTGGCLLVAAAGRTRHARLRESLELLPRRAPLGVFLNENPAAQGGRHYEGYYEARIDEQLDDELDEETEPVVTPRRRATNRGEDGQ